MKYTALVTRMYSMADESLQIIIQDTDDYDTFKQRVFNVLKVTDYRANVQMQRLFEDSDLTNELTYDELQSARKAANLMYPNEGLPHKLDLGSGEKRGLEFAKNLPSGEVLKIFLHDIETYDDIENGIRSVWDIIDSRLRKTNDREIKFMSYLKSLPFQVRLKVSKIMDILYGRMMKETLVEQLRGEALKETIETIREENTQAAEENSTHAS